MTHELKPCPFCGEEEPDFMMRKPIDHDCDEDKIGCLYVECPECDGSGEGVTVRSGCYLHVYLTLAAANWNRRA